MRYIISEVVDPLVERLEALPLLGSDTADPAARLTSLLEVAPGVARQTHSRALIALDEVQDALALPALAGLLEAVKSRGGTQLGLVFIAPELPAEALATVVDRSASVSVGPIEPGVFGEEIVRRFAATGRDAGEAGQVIATVGGGHPQRSSLLGGVSVTSGRLVPRARKAWAEASQDAHEPGHELQLEPIGLHECRHTYASFLMAAGYTLRELMEYRPQLAPGHRALREAPPAARRPRGRRRSAQRVPRREDEPA